MSQYTAWLAASGLVENPDRRPLLKYHNPPLQSSTRWDTVYESTRRDNVRNYIGGGLEGPIDTTQRTDEGKRILGYPMGPQLPQARWAKCPVCDERLTYLTSDIDPTTIFCSEGCQEEYRRDH